MDDFASQQYRQMIDSLPSQQYRQIMDGLPSQHYQQMGPPMSPPYSYHTPTALPSPMSFMSDEPSHASHAYLLSPMSMAGELPDYRPSYVHPTATPEYSHDFWRLSNVYISANGSRLFIPPSFLAPGAGTNSEGTILSPTVWRRAPLVPSADCPSSMYPMYDHAYTLQIHHDAQRGTYDFPLGLPPPFVYTEASADNVSWEERCGLDDYYLEGPYAQLIGWALRSRPDHTMPLQELYQWFRDNTVKPETSTGRMGWTNSIRHNLSMNAGFEKVYDQSSGRGTKKSTSWKLTTDAAEYGVQSTTRFRRQTSKKRQGSGKPSPARQAAGARGGRRAVEGKKQRLRKQRLLEQQSLEQHPQLLPMMDGLPESLMPIPVTIRTMGVRTGSRAGPASQFGRVKRESGPLFSPQASYNYG